MTDAFNPVFNFDGDLPSADDIDNILATASGSGGSVLRPGTYELVVKNVILSALAEGRDKSWFNARIVLGGTGKLEAKETSLFLLVPATGKLTYTNAKGEESGYPLKNFMDTMNGLGIETTKNNIKDIILSYFRPENLKNLHGRVANVTIGYTRPHASFISTGEGGEGYVAIVDGTEKVKDADGEILKFTGDDAYKAAAAKAKELGIRFQAFPEVINLTPVEVSGGDVSNSGW